MSNIEQSDFILDGRMRLASKTNRLSKFMHTSNTVKGPNERRCITRQDVGQQRRIIIGAIYASSAYDGTLSLKHGKQPFFAVLKNCIDEHPIMSTVILNGDTESPTFATPKTLDLNAHLEIREPNSDCPEDKCIEKLMAQIGDEQCTSLHTTPPWKVVLVPLRTNGASAESRLLVLFSNYHSHGDGRSGLAFHNSFHAGLVKHFGQTNKEYESIESTCEAPTKPLLPPIEEGGKMTLSWSFLLTPLIGTYLPAPIASFFGIRDSWLTQEAGIWRGKQTTFDEANHVTGLVLLIIDATTISKVLKQCRANKATFTGLLEHLIVRSLVAPDGGAITLDAFNTGIAVDMRHLFGDRYSGGSMLNCVTGYSELVVLDRSLETVDWATDPSSIFWEAARKTSAGLKAASSTLHNQPIGLLQYLKDFRSWTTGQIGKERDTSFEISNLGAFSPASQTGQAVPDITIEKVVFSQPAKASGGLLDFNPVSLKGGPLAMTITWQRGVLGLADGDDETEFVRKISSKLESLIQEIAASSS
jgi:hypothetical protein